MTTIYTDRDADPKQLEGCSVAVVGYGNQGRSWALNLRDSGLDPQVCVRADASREPLSRVLLLQLLQARVAGSRLGVPLVGEAPAADGVDDPAHDREEVE